jgi:hypothetical protein
VRFVRLCMSIKKTDCPACQISEIHGKTIKTVKSKK